MCVVLDCRVRKQEENKIKAKTLGGGLKTATDNGSGGEVKIRQGKKKTI